MTRIKTVAFDDADEALRVGLVNHVVPHEELLPLARALATDIVNNDQIGVRRLMQHYRALAKMAKRDVNLRSSHSIEEAESRHARKHHPAHRR